MDTGKPPSFYSNHTKPSRGLLNALKFRLNGLQSGITDGGDRAKMAQQNWILHSCDVCTVLDGDQSEKTSYWCDVCQAWICQKDEYRLDRRARAMMKLKRTGKPCSGCGDRNPDVPAFDEVQQKSVGQMSFAERLQYDLRLRSQRIMESDEPLHAKRQKIQEIEREVEQLLEQHLNA